MLTNKRTIRKDLAYIRKNITRLKRDVLQLRKLIKQEKPLDFTLIKSREVKKMLRISTSTLQMMRNKGKIPFQRRGVQTLYEYNDVKNLLLEGKTGKR